jgi:hypothetical protein
MSLPRTAVFLATLGMLWGCGATHRIIRPQLSGFVYDGETGYPLRGCQVGEVTTDGKGYFMLPQKTSSKISYSGSVPYPILISEFVVFQGYEMVRLYSFKTWGVSRASDPLEIKPIYLWKLEDDKKIGSGSQWREISPFAPVSKTEKGKKDFRSPIPDE